MDDQLYPLSDVTVIDLGQIYQGPYASFLMAMAGADVVKVEPVGGERLRGVPHKPTLAFAMLNSNKRSITLDLKQARGRELLIALAKRGDVLLENYAPGVLDRLGIGASVLRAENPRLIYATGTGFGISGPDRDQLAMDHTVQAMSGMMSVTGEPGGKPLRAGGAVADILGGVHLYAGIVTALLARARTGEGGTVEVSMQESMFATFSSAYTNFHHTGRVPGPVGNGPLGIPMAPYNVYATKDGYLAIICVTDEHWQRLAAELGQPELGHDPRFCDRAQRGRNASEIDALVGAWAAARTRSEAYEAVRSARVPVAPVRDLAELIEDPHLHERGALARVTHRDLGAVVLPRSPLRLLDLPLPEVTSSPHVGEHNRDVYGGWLGLSDADLAELERDGVI